MKRKPYPKIATLDAMLALLHTLHLTPMGLAAFQHARRLGDDACETSVCMDANEAAEWGPQEELDQQYESDREDCKDFVRDYYEGVDEALKAIMRSEEKKVRKPKSRK